MGTDKEKKAIAAAIATFPGSFGLRAFPGDVFRIGEDQSYFTGPGECGGVMMLYTQRLRGEEWQDFAKGTADELTRNIVRR